MKIRDILENNRLDIISKYENGVSTNKLAKEYNCNPGSIYFFLKANKVEVKKNPNRNMIVNNGEEVIRLYNDGLSSRDIAKKLGVTKTSILRYLISKGIDTSVNYTCKNKPHLTEFKDQVIQDYLDGMGHGEIARKYGYNQSAVTALLHKNNIEIRDFRIDVDEDFFSIIDTEEKAYVLGWLYADGNVNKNTWRIQIADLDILEKIKELVKYKGEIADVQPPKKFPHRKVQYTINVCRKKMVDDLARLGVVPKKSLIIKFPTEDQVPKHLLGHFLRGVFDGDGSITKCAKGGFAISLTSTQDFLDEMMKLFKSDFSLYERFPDRKTTSRSLMCGKKSAIYEFLDFIYRDATVYLDRKYKLYKEFVQWYTLYPDGI